MQLDLSDMEINLFIAGLALLAEATVDPGLAAHLSTNGQLNMARFFDGADRYLVLTDTLDLADRVITCRDTA